jgi:hypothetical protein
MKEVTLSTGQMVKIEPLTIKQVRNMDALVAAEKHIDATVGACVDAIHNAGGGITIDDFESSYFIPDVNELYRTVAEITGITLLGEAKANG